MTLDPERTVLAGRCACGQILEWVAKKPDDHLKCIGLRWCRICGEAARIGSECRPCKRRRNREYVKRYLQKPENRAKRNAISKRHDAKIRRGNAPAYQRQKAQKRLRYRTDPAYAERIRERWRQKRREKIAA